MKRTNFTGYPELRELQETLENRVRQNMRQELGPIVQSAIADALQKVFPNGTAQTIATDSGATPENRPSTTGRTKKKAKQLPRPRSSTHNTFKVREQRTIHVVLLMSCWQKSIRELGQALLGLESPKDMPQPVSQKEIDAWDTNCGPCCTVENFRIDLVGYTRSGWNKSAAQVFAMEYLKRHKGENYTLEFVVEAWLTRVAGMKAQYRRLQHNESALKKYKVLHQRRQWKGEVRHKLLVFALLTCSSCTNAASTLLASTMISESKPFI